MGGGVLPASIVDGEPVFLFAREAASRAYRDSGKWSDFGGSKEGNELPRATAEREAAEEGAGLLGAREDVAALIDAQLVTVLEVSGYTAYVVYVPYWGGFPEAFRQIYDDAVATKPSVVEARNGLFEKDDAEWVRLSDLKSKSSGLEFRQWYVRSGMLGKITRHKWSGLFAHDAAHHRAGSARD
jgi:8-oxo-dGTP pyrophosphatase MutT (NUDIX family)